MADSICVDMGRYQVRYRKGGNGKRYLVWEPKTGLTLHSADGKLECIEFIAGLENLYNLVACHPWGRVA
jgi:hypothetical protein